MKTIKKYYEIFKLNRQISHLQRELLGEAPVLAFAGAHSYRPVQRRESEKSFFIRENLDELRIKKEHLKTS